MDITVPCVDDVGAHVEEKLRHAVLEDAVLLRHVNRVELPLVAHEEQRQSDDRCQLSGNRISPLPEQLAYRVIDLEGGSPTAVPRDTITAIGSSHALCRL